MRIRITILLLALMFVAGNRLADAAKPASETTVAKDGRLSHALTFKDVQGGFAGFTGQSYHIEPDGTWSITRVFNQRKYKPKKTGKLTDEQMKTLIAALKTNHLLKLPKESGSRAQANPKVLTITFGKKKSSIAVRAGLENPDDLPKDESYDAARQAFAIRKAILSLIQPKPKKSES